MADAEDNKRAVSTENPAGEEFMSIEYTADTQLPETILKTEKDQCYSLSDKLLEAYVVRYALTAEKIDEKPLKHYLFNKQIEILQNIFAEDNFDEKTSLSDEIDIFEKLCNYLIKMQQESINS